MVHFFALFTWYRNNPRSHNRQRRADALFACLCIFGNSAICCFNKCLLNLMQITHLWMTLFTAVLACMFQNLSRKARKVSCTPSCKTMYRLYQETGEMIFDGQNNCRFLLFDVIVVDLSIHSNYSLFINKRLQFRKNAVWWHMSSSFQCLSIFWMNKCRFVCQNIWEYPKSKYCESSANKKCMQKYRKRQVAL